MRIRSIRPEFWRSFDIAALDWETRLIYIGLWSYVDDNGVGIDSVQMIAGDLFALEEDAADVRKKVGRALEELESHGMIQRYGDNKGKRYLFIPSWDRHQRVQKPNRIRYRRPSSTAGDSLALFYEDLTSISRDPLETLQRTPGDAPGDSSGQYLAVEEVVKEKGRRGEGSARGTRLPTSWALTPELRKYAEEHAPSLDIETELEAFKDYWAAKPGKDAVKLDWDATWRGWVRRGHQRKLDNGWHPPVPSGQEWLYQ